MAGGQPSSSKVLEPGSIYPGKAEEGGIWDLCWEGAWGGPLWLSLPQGHFRPIRSEGCQGQGLQEGVEQGKEGS